jgi:hypothetical protein
MKGVNDRFLIALLLVQDRRHQGRRPEAQAHPHRLRDMAATAEPDCDCILCKRLYQFNFGFDVTADGIVGLVQL